MFTPEEVEAVVVGLRMAEAFGGPRLRAAATPALNKVILALPKGRRAEVDRPQIYAPAVNALRGGDGLLEILRVAIHERAVLRLKYTDDRGRESERSVQPLALHFWGSAWTLAAWCRSRKGFRSFRLDRIRGCERSGDTFIEEPGKTLDDFLRSVGAS
jgi:predicted DNA-binding transcriptional regulator YafY